MTSLFRSVQARWKESGLCPSPGATETELNAFESRHSVHLPLEVREYFTKLNGTVEGSQRMDNDTIAWWRLDEVKSLREEGFGDLPDADRCFVFADYLIRSHDYALRLGTDREATASIVINYGRRLVQAAPSLHEFLEGYVRTDWDILASYP